MDVAPSQLFRNVFNQFVLAYNALLTILFDDYNAKVSKLWDDQYQVDRDKATMARIRKDLDKWMVKEGKTQHQKEKLRKILDYEAPSPEIITAPPTKLTPPLITLQTFGFDLPPPKRKLNVRPGKKTTKKAKPATSTSGSELCSSAAATDLAKSGATCISNLLPADRAHMANQREPSADKHQQESLIGHFDQLTSEATYSEPSGVEETTDVLEESLTRADISFQTMEDDLVENPRTEDASLAQVSEVHTFDLFAGDIVLSPNGGNLYQILTDPSDHAGVHAVAMNEEGISEPLVDIPAASSVNTASVADSLDVPETPTTNSATTVTLHAASTSATSPFTMVSDQEIPENLENELIETVDNNNAAEQLADEEFFIDLEQNGLFDPPYKLS